METFEIGEKVSLKKSGDKKYLLLRRYDTIFYSDFGIVSDIVRDEKTGEPNSYIVKFEKEGKFEVVDIPAEYLERFEERKVYDTNRINDIFRSFKGKIF